jgi:hypothetical protein
MKNNQYNENTKSSKTKGLKLYKSREAFEEDFSIEKKLLGVIVKTPDGDVNLYVCYEEMEKSWFVLVRVKFNDDSRMFKIQSIITPILSSKKEDSGMFVLSFKGRDEIHKWISGFVSMHPKVTRNQ